MKKFQESHCCKRLDHAISSKDNPIEYNPIFREYSVRLIYNAVALEGIDYCPWCTYKFPKSLRNHFVHIVRLEYLITGGITAIFDNPDLPEEFKSDVWWKKRGL